MSELTLNFGPVGVQRVGDVVLEKIPCIWMLGGEKKKKNPKNKVAFGV